MRLTLLTNFFNNSLAHSLASPLAACLLCACTLLSSAVAQNNFGAGYGPPLQVQVPAKSFTTSDDHYAWLLAQAKGGTQHTLASVPRWDGLWETAGNSHLNLFVEGGSFQGKVKPDVLTPAYEQAYRERWRQQQEEGQVRYDRLSGCEPAGLPRWLLEPYTHEFINLPQQSYLINDFANSIRRVYIGQPHRNLTGTHSWLGDTVGFWEDDQLIMHTKYLLPADFTRWSPMTSNQFETVETWQLKHYGNEIDRLEVQVTFYDRYAFVKPLHAVYAFKQAAALEKAGHRPQHWECETSSNSYLDENGMTNFKLPGEEGYKDARGSTLFPDLPGQNRDPIYNTTLTTD
jgi:hypothetical protein